MTTEQALLIYRVGSLHGYINEGWIECLRQDVVYSFESSEVAQEAKKFNFSVHSFRTVNRTSALEISSGHAS